MFTVDPSFTHLSARPEQILALLQSINAISVKVPGVQAAPATAFIVAWDVGNGNATAIIYLYYAESHRFVVYVPDPRAFPITSLPVVIEEAKEFLESMGFMLDDPAFGTRPAEEKQRLIERTPVFHQDLARFAAMREAEEVPEVEVIELTDSVEPEPVASVAPSDAKRTEAIGRILMSY